MARAEIRSREDFFSELRVGLENGEVALTPSLTGQLAQHLNSIDYLDPIELSTFLSCLEACAHHIRTTGSQLRLDLSPVARILGSLEIWDLEIALTALIDQPVQGETDVLRLYCRHRELFIRDLAKRALSRCQVNGWFNRRAS